MSLKQLRKALKGKTKAQLIRIILAIFSRAPTPLKHSILRMVKIGVTARKTKRKSKRKRKSKAKRRRSKSRRKSSRSSGGKRSKLSIKRERIRNLNKGRKKAGLKPIPIPKR